MFSLRLLVFVLIFHSPAAGSGEPAIANSTAAGITEPANPSSQSNSTKMCDYERLKKIAPDRRKNEIDNSLYDAMKIKNQSDLASAIDKLMCEMDFWGTPNEVFTTAIREAKGSYLEAWKILMIDNAERRYREKSLIATEAVTTTTTTTTTTAPTTVKLVTAPDGTELSRVDISSCSNNSTVCFYDRNCAQASKKNIDMVPFSASVTTDVSNCAFVAIRKAKGRRGKDQRDIDFQTPFDSVLSVTWNGTTIEFHPMEERVFGVKCVPESLCVVDIVYPRKRKDHNGGLHFQQAGIELRSRDDVGKPNGMKNAPVPGAQKTPEISKKEAESKNQEESGIGSIILYCALGILFLLAIAIVVGVMYQRRANKRAARMRALASKGSKTSTSLSDAANTSKLSDERKSLIPSTPNAPTPRTNKTTPRPIRSHIGVTSPSLADPTQRTHSSAGVSERACEMERRRHKSSNSHTQTTQSTAHQELDSPQ